MFSGYDPNQEAAFFWNSLNIEKLSSLGTKPGAPAANSGYNKRQQSFFSSIVTDTAIKWFEGEVAKTTTWKIPKKNKIFLDGRDQLRFRLEVENTFRQEGELIKNYLHRIKSGVYKAGHERQHQVLLVMRIY